MTPIKLLKKYFGYDEFRLGQEQVIDRVIGGQDVLAVMPTGGGKSVCYQIPALSIEGVTLVISPLISLMKDQVDALNVAGVAATQISSALDSEEIRIRLEDTARGRYKIVYVAPERLQSAVFKQMIGQLSVSLVAIDEAHCVSQWGHDFRPSYTGIAQWISEMKQRPVVVAFTATATREVREDVVKLLQLHNPYVHIAGFDRPNLHFAVRRGVSKVDFIIDYLATHPGDAGIIYAATRKEVEKVHQCLVRAGFKAGRYHAGLEDDERTRNQDDFLKDNIEVMVATNAFGLGIDKSNVRYVIHHNMPRHVEAYYQEAGRAGRDGLASECLLLFSPGDIQTQKYLIEHSDLSPEKKSIEYGKLQSMVDYCHSPRCLRNYILGYFGEQAPDRCPACSNCTEDNELQDVTVEAQKILSCVTRMNERFGITMVADVLHGSNNQKTRNFSLQTLSTFGLMKELKIREIVDLINLLVAEGYLAVSEGPYPLLQLGSGARLVLQGNREVLIRRARSLAMERSDGRKKGKDKRQSLEQGQAVILKSMQDRKGEFVDKELLVNLKALRLEIARDAEIAPFIVFHDSTLREMCLRLPQDQESMLEVPGVGEKKFESYGRRFLEAIQDYVAQGE
ncbi:MAG: DNA helicase RecQ [Acidobacteriota bacterium]